MDSDGPLLAVTERGLTVRYRGRNLYSPVDPVGSAERRARAVPIADSTLYLLPSPLLFYGVDVLLSSLPENSHLLCVETDQRLMRLSLETAPKRLVEDPRLTYVRSDAADGVLVTLRALGLGRFKRCREVILNGGRSIEAQWYARVFGLVQFEIQSYWRNRLTLVHMSHLWVKNLFLNLPNLVGALDLQSLKTELPIVVAGAGESLEESIPLLREVRSRVYLLAVDTAILSLHAGGIEPDGIVALEAQFANLADFIGSDQSKSAGVVDLSSCPACIRRFEPGRRFFFLSQFAELALFDRLKAFGLLPTLVPPLGSVGIAGLYCATSMTKSPILFSGLDFAFRPGKIHARGSPTHRRHLRTANRIDPNAELLSGLAHPFRRVTGKGGGELWTSPGLSSYLQSLSLLASGTNRFRDLGKLGLVSGTPTLTDRNEILKLVRAEDTRPNGTARPLSRACNDVGLHSPFVPQKILAFLQEERKLHARLVAAGTRLLETRKAVGSKLADPAEKQFREALKSVEYVRLHFPDRPGESRLSESFIKRALEASDTCVRWIDRAGTLVETQRE